MSVKTLFIYSLLLSVLLSTGIACKKTSESPTVKYRVTHILDSAYYYSDPTYGDYQVVIDYRITYANNRISGISSTVTNPSAIPTISPSDVATFYFYPSSYAIHHLLYPTYADSVIFNDLHEIVSSTGGFNSASFEYNSNLQVTFYGLSGFYTSSYGSYSWDINSNITKIVSTDTATVDYYTDKPSTIGDYNEINYFLAFGNTIVHTKNLTKSIISPTNVTTIDYSFDNNGNITNTRARHIAYSIYYPTQTTTHSYSLEYESYTQ